MRHDGEESAMHPEDLNAQYRVNDVVDDRSGISRRRFLELMGAAGVGAVVASHLGGGVAAAAGTAPATTATVVFPDGIMSGDPRPDGTVLWTRLAPPPGGGDVTVGWEVAADDTFSTVVAGGTTTALASAGYTAKVAVEGLAPNSWYRYRFVSGGVVSATGRMRTAPTPDSSPDKLVLAWVSCQQISSWKGQRSGYVAHRLIADEPDIDFWMHLGDYVYVNDQQTQSVQNYRDVYARFKENPDLQYVQAMLPTVAMYDDGEFVNGVHRNIQPEGRLANALQVWFEQFPVIPPDDEQTRSHRALRWGDLAELFVLDVRQYRDAEVEEGSGNNSVIDRERFNPERTTLGEEQREWLLEGLTDTDAVWRLLGNPYNFAPLRILGGADQPSGSQTFTTDFRDLKNIHVNQATYAPNEAWDDFWYERRVILDHLAANNIENLISLSAHTHIWLADVLVPDYDNPDDPVVGFDFTCGSLTADPDFSQVEIYGIGGNGDPDRAYTLLQVASGAMEEWNPWKAYVNFVNQGYGLITLEPGKAVVEFKSVNTFDPDATPDLLARFTIVAGERRMKVELWPTPCYTCGPNRTLTPVVPSRMFPSVLPRSSFSDVPRSAGFATAVDWLAANGITTGVGPDRYDPEGVIPRWQMALFLWRMMDSPAVAGNADFVDVVPGSPAGRAVRWLEVAGVTQIAPGADGRRRFRPAEPVNRAQMAAFLWRLAGSPSGAPRSPFTDVPRSAFFAEAVDWLAHWGITTGRAGTNRFDPQGLVTRAQMALFLWRLASATGAWSPSVALPSSVRSALI